MKETDGRLAQEVAQFNAMAKDWWDPNGSCRLLHDINPIRTQYIADQIALLNKKVLDVGCGGGILAESLCRRGAQVTGIDAAGQIIDCARKHAHDQALTITYDVSTAENWLQYNPDRAGTFDIVTCLELLEHVADPMVLIQTLSTLLKPGGHLFLSTLNRTPKAFLYAIIGVEYLFGWLPRGMHQYRDFIRPSELRSWLQAANCGIKGMTGIGYHPWTRKAKRIASVEVNYMLYAQRLG